jgi:MSHA pilin protein MshD
MCMSERTTSRQRGFTLIELIIFIVVVSVGLAGILVVMNTSVKSSADPMVRKQAIALAESILEEVLQKAYADPDGSNAGETGRDNWDNVDDYDGKTQTAFSLPPALSAYTIAITVTDGSAAMGIAARKVVVKVSKGIEAISLTGYRTDY